MNPPEPRRGQPTLADLHSALRQGLQQEAQRIAALLQERFRREGQPQALRRFVASVLAEATDSGSGSANSTNSTNSRSGAAPADGSWTLAAQAGPERIAAALAIWNSLMAAPVRLQPPASGGRPWPVSTALADHDPALLAAALATAGDRLPWLDGWYCNSHRLRLRLGQPHPSQPRRWQVLQWHPRHRQLRPCATLALEGALEPVLDVPLHDALAPLLLRGEDAAGAIAELLVLPFPSLLRQGLHHGELVAAHERQDGPAAIGAYSLRCLIHWQDPSLERVDSWSVRLPAGAAGGLHQQADVADWLAWMGQRTGNEGANKQALELEIEGDGLPSLVALTGLPSLSRPGDAGRQGEPPFVVLDPIDLRPRLLVRPGRSPRNRSNAAEDGDVFGCAVRLQRRGHDGPEPLTAEEPVALLRAPGHEQRRAPLWLPLDAAAPAQRGTGGPTAAAEPIGVHLLLHGLGDPDDLEFTLWSLEQQRGVTLRSLRPLIGGAEASAALAAVRPLLEAIAPTTALHPLDTAPSLMTLLAELPAGERIGLIRAGVCLHNPETLRRLDQLLEPEEVASAGCLLIHARAQGRDHSLVAASCGLVPAALDLGRSDELELLQLTLLEELGPRQRSVLANTADLVLIDPQAPCWRRPRAAALTGPIEQQWLDASLEAVLAGGLHRASAELSALYRTPPPADQRHRARLGTGGGSLLTALPHLLAAGLCVDPLKP